MIKGPVVNITVNNIDIRYHYSRDRVTIVWSLWRHQQSILASSECKPNEWDTDFMRKDCVFYRHLWIRYIAFAMKLYMYPRDKLFMCSLEGYCGV